MFLRIGLVILTLDAGKDFAALLKAVNDNGNFFCRKIVVDSSSTDGTPALAKAAGFDVLSITRSEFNHGGTRRFAAEILREHTDVIVFLTQDVVIDKVNCFAELVKPFADEQVGMTYGRQLPRTDATPLAALLREFNYPAESCRKTLADKTRLGLKTPFASDTFAAYRTTALFEAGNFPPRVCCSEDMFVAGQLLLRNYAVVYNANAVVRHSHEFNLKSAWQRYKNIGAFHAEQKWLAQTFGRPEGEGLRLLKMQLSRAWERGGLTLAAKIIADDALKFIAYRVGKIMYEVS